MGACQPDGDWFVSAISSGTYFLPYNGPTLSQADICNCNSVSYSLISACGACQGDEIPLWASWTTNCPTSNIYNGEYPYTIPGGTAVPAWAFSSVSVEFDLGTALIIADELKPDVTGGAAVSSGLASPASSGSSRTGASGSTTPFSNPQSTGIYGSGAPNNPIATSDISNTHTSVPVAVIAGAVGGGGGALLIGITVLIISCRRRKTRAVVYPIHTPTLPAMQYSEQYPKFAAATYMPPTLPMSEPGSHDYPQQPSDPSAYIPVVQHSSPPTELSDVYPEALSDRTEAPRTWSNPFSGTSSSYTASSNPYIASSQTAVSYHQPINPQPSSTARRSKAEMMRNESITASAAAPTTQGASTSATHNEPDDAVPPPAYSETM